MLAAIVAPAPRIGCALLRLAGSPGCPVATGPAARRRLRRPVPASAARPAPGTVAAARWRVATPARRGGRRRRLSRSAGPGAAAWAWRAGLRRLVVGEELLPGLPDRVRVLPELLVHLLDQPGVGPEARTRRRRRRSRRSRVPVAPDAWSGRRSADDRPPVPGPRSAAHYESRHRGHDRRPWGVRIEQPVDRQDPQRRRRRPQRQRQDDAGRGAARCAPACWRRAGRVEDGTTVCDTEPEEVKRTMSLSLALAPFEWTGVRRRDLQDQPHRHPRLRRLRRRRRRRALRRRPGRARRQRRRRRRGRHRVGLGQVRRRRHPADGVRQQGGQAARRLPPRARPAAGDVRVRLRAARAAARRGGGASTASPTCSPTRASSTSPTAATTPSRSPTTSPTRSTACTTSSSRRSSSGDDEQLERYLSGDVPTTAELERTLAHELLDQLEFPVLVRLGAHRRRRRPAGRLHLRARPVARRPPDDGRSPAAATAASRSRWPPTRPASRWPTCSRRSPTSSSARSRCSRCCRAPIAVDDRLVNTASGTEERMHGLFHLRGKEHLADRPGRRRRPRRRRQAGRHARPARRWRRRTRPCASPPPPPPTPVFGLALQAGHPVRRRQAVGRAAAPARRGSRRSPSTATRRPARPCCAACGDTHVAVALERLARKFGVNVETEDVRVPYRETITGSAEAEGKVKKQSGGHGQYAVANLRVSPMGRGEGTEFVNSIVGGTIPKQYIPAVQRGVEETMATGGVHGFPVVDVRVECYDGKFHSVDSSDMAFRTAAAHGLQGGAAEGRRGRARADLAADRRRCPRATRATCSATSTPAAAGSAAPARSATATTRSSPSSRRPRSSATPSSCAR